MVVGARPAVEAEDGWRRARRRGRRARFVNDLAITDPL